MGSIEITSSTSGELSREWTLSDGPWWLADVELLAPNHERREIAAALVPVLDAVVRHAGDLDATIAALQALKEQQP